VWGAKANKKTCEDCKKLQDPKAFEQGAQVRIAGVGDCKNCEVMKNQPIARNENIVSLYNALPREGGVTVKDIYALFEIYEIPQVLQFDYYQRLIYLHNMMLDEREKEHKKVVNAQKTTDQWKAKKFPVGRRRIRRTH